MKKIVGIIAAAALATSAFADVNIGLGANQAFAPIAYDGDNLVNVGPDANWGNMNSSKHVGRIGISFSAGNDVAGVVTDIHNEDGSHDNAYGWVKPFSFLEIKAGKIDTNWRRLGFGYGAWNTLRPIGIDSVGDDLAFYRPLQPNLALKLTPIEGLEIVWDYQADVDGETNRGYNELWNHARYGVSYTIDSVGTILAQVVGADPYKNKDNDEVKFSGRANLAFQLTGVEGLDAQFGVAAPLTFDYKSGDIQFAAGAHYKFDALTFHGFFDGRIKENDDGDAYGNFGFALGGGVDFAVNDAVTLIADVRYNNKKYNGVTKGAGKKDGKAARADDGSAKWEGYNAGVDIDATDHLVVFAGVEHKISNAAIRTGFVGSTNSVIGDHLTDSGKFQDFTFGIPVVLDINF